MHCPSCGQQQVSNETKFCSRCGMPLSVVAEVVSYGGYLPQLTELNNKTTLFTRRNGVAFSIIWCLFFLLIMTPIFGIVNIDELAGASAIIGIFGGLIMLISSLIFLKKPFLPDARFGQQVPSGLYGQHQNAALAETQFIAAQQFATPQVANWRDTNDLQPTSVTEGTTKLLEQEGNLHAHDSRPCPSCGTTYTDESLKYCLIDGAPLRDLAPEQETLVRSHTNR